ncbi:putative carboxyvinyl-carboxyphosphonate phosphorylmutase [Aeropyrum pernix K1]|uniref:2-methylisocitrate lyase n=1 Tax=Aeropyrum pernix (strain ATCC 700893 / DSM 11879 / JCM 9820 / NBRC 100138 / K1) TaxID=272557 RepID=PRPB_AERPE|nr:methylisocitrate lyase [Aeropyrum pernix]Q9YFM7.2 RecName: Full=2-methylisocitrate lyase; Short=2-MIC; Short=MICL; AltName: Full=(2R,3S)-2-methylisocitrate lyase [Aeropyrum pernix K1]BAA79134.2 putative carboxyvinyl-carboxyphosphonate phosphorylmutase [Aeropyrum pernix K1]
MAFLYREPLERPGLVLRELIEKRDIVVAPGVYNPAVALLAERMGFEALYLSGAAITGSLAMPDLGLITLSELAMFTSYITRVVRVPVIVDADTGFGEAINVERTVRELERAGAAAIQIEDQVMPKKCGHLQGKALISPEDMVKKIIAAVGARRDALIVARTDARGVEGFEKAVERAQLYVEAGADIIFPEALTSLEEFREFARRVKAPLLANMTEFGKTPYITVDQFREAGYKIVIFPVTTFRASLKASETVLREIMEKGTQKDILDKLYTRTEFYDLIGYHDYEKRDAEVSRKAEELLARHNNSRTG